MTDSTSLRYADHEDHFRNHYRENYNEGESHTYGDYEAGYRSGFRYGTSSEHEGRSFGDLEPEMRRRHEKEHGEGTWPKVKGAARHAFERGRSHRTDHHEHDDREHGHHEHDNRESEDVTPKSPSGSGQTASGGPGSAMREGGFDVHREAYQHHHDETHGDDGEHDFAHREPAYRYGHRYGTAGEHEGRSFDDLEPEMRRSYEKEHGEGTWAKVKGAARHAFEHSRSHSSRSSTASRTP